MPVMALSRFSRTGSWISSGVGPSAATASSGTRTSEVGSAAGPATGLMPLGFSGGDRALSMRGATGSPRLPPVAGVGKTGRRQAGRTSSTTLPVARRSSSAFSASAARSSGKRSPIIGRMKPSSIIRAMAAPMLRVRSGLAIT